MTISAILAAHYPAVLALNESVVEKTGPLDAARLAWMISEAFQAVQVGEGRDAVLLAFAEGSAYDSPNYRWLAARYPRFTYVDRIVVAPHARGRGLARALYDGLIAKTRRTGRPVVTCEVNLEPPNPGSDAFHAALGFEEVGRGSPDGGKKLVRYLALTVARA
ncbi:MAG: GNAT family N-acetyltransferase [Alphaproteobacteria bacterium]|nr:GNAT family N-acetyltransferase [Alphaproteobacteria bacterium]